MSRLYASVDADASKTTATRRGYRRIVAHVRGWDDGVRVVAGVSDDGQGVDTFDIFRTAGSNGSHADVWLGRVVGGTFIPATYPHDLETDPNTCPVDGGWLGSESNDHDH
jgi:hypothetical protein